MNFKKYPKGNTILICGISGSGKTSLFCDVICVNKLAHIPQNARDCRKYKGKKIQWEITRYWKCFNSRYTRPFQTKAVRLEDIIDSKIDQIQESVGGIIYMIDSTIDNYSEDSEYRVSNSQIYI